MNDNKIRTKFTEMSKIFKEVIDEYDKLKTELSDAKEENEKLKHQIEKHKEAYSLMCSEKTRRYNELMIEKEHLEAKERYNIMDSQCEQSDYLDFQKAHKI